MLHLILELKLIPLFALLTDPFVTTFVNTSNLSMNSASYMLCCISFLALTSITRIL